VPRYNRCNKIIGKYWLIGHYNGFPLFMKEDSVKPLPGLDYDIKQSTMLFYQPSSKCWWLCHPGYGFENLETQWLGKGVLPEFSGMEMLSAVQWHIPCHGHQPTTMIRVQSSHRWLGLQVKKEKSAKQAMVEQYHLMKKHIDELEEENKKLKDQLQEVQPAQAAQDQPHKGYGRKGYSKDEGGDRAKAGWMNKMVALVTAIDLEQWSRVTYLKDKFLGHHSIEHLVSAHKKVLEKWGKDPAYDY
jgi:hypothetical protein